MKRISILGAGRMGSALARAFAKAGHDVLVWNRSPKQLDGLRMAASLEEVATADLVVDVVADYDASAALRERLADVLRGKTFLELASGAPKHARRAAAWASERGVAYLEGAIMATPDFIATPGCTILYSGAHDLYERHAPELGALGDNALYVGTEIGAANALDNALLVVLWGATHGMLQGAAICEAETFPLGAFAKALKGCFPMIEATLGAASGRIAERRWRADAETPATLGICHASVKLVRELSADHGIDGGLPDALDRVFTRAALAGHTDDDVAAAYVGMTLSPS